MSYNNLFKLIIFLGLCNTMLAQSTAEISNHINNLSNKEKQEEAVISLYQIHRQNPSVLNPHVTELNKTINTILQSPEFNYTLANLALELSYVGNFQLNEDSEKNLSQQNKEKRTELKQVDNYHSWIWDNESYLNDRAECSLILDLLGYGSSQISLDELLDSLEYFKDNRPKYFAATSLLRRSEKIDPQHIFNIAKDDETRGLLYQYLSDTNKSNLFPKEFNNQEDLSRADMVNWLTYPTELARVPSKIELVKVFTIEYNDVGPADFYLWKFMSNHENWIDDGWMTGLSGPFIRSNTPTMISHGYTFSGFSKLEEKTPQQHFETIVNAIDKWMEQNQN